MYEPFDEWFKRMRKFMEEFDKMIDEMFRTSIREWTEEELRGERPRFKHYVYGFSVTIGPDGRPIIREFGNIRPTYRGPLIREVMEPFVDVVEEPDVIRVVAELPGVEKKDIDLHATETTLTIETKGKRRYYKVVKLPCKVKPQTAKAKYRNGILEVVLEKAEKEARKKGFRVRIE